MLIPKSLQNSSDWGELPTIVIKLEDKEFVEAYKNWKDGKNPTNSPEWKKGVILTFKKVDIQ